MTVTINHRSLIYTSLLGVFIAASLIVPLFSNNASAIDPSAVGFNAGDILDDSVMTNSKTMTQAQIQTFLKSKNSCDNTDLSVLAWHDATSGYMTDSKGNKYWYDLSDGHFLCMADDTFNGQTAAQIIYQAAQTYNINPQVLIVVLQKEQGLITDTWPNNVQYQSATGYGCPDGAACDSQYFGLSNQVNWTAKMYQAIETASPTWYTPYLVGNNYIQYNPSASCGGSTVDIQNRATQALYNYTPYQPNAATLDAPMGTTVTCGAYGNLNFYRYFTQWFGSTHITFIPLSDPRYMQLSTDAQKVDALTGQPVGDTFSTGLQRLFLDKVISINGTQCLRTQSDQSQGNPYCFPMNDLTALKPVYTSLTPAEGTMEATVPVYKIDMSRPDKNISGPYPVTWQRSFVAKTTIDSKTYYVTDVDYNNGTLGGFVSTSLVPSPVYQAIPPTWFVLSQDSAKYLPLQQTAYGGAYNAGLERPFTSRTEVNGTWYYRTESDSSQTLSQAFPSTELQTPPYTPFSSPRWMVIDRNTTEYTPSTGLSTGASIASGTQYMFTSKIIVDGKQYYRTADDTTNGTDRAFLASDVADISFEPFSDPRQLRLTQDAHKYFPISGVQSPDSFSAGLTREFTTKVFVNGQWYYRTNADTTFGIPQAFPASILAEV